MFWRIAFTQLPHHALLFLAVKRKNTRLIARLDRHAQKRLKAPLNDALPEVITAYKNIAGHVELWHGTGRFQYVHGNIVDVLQTIIDSGMLQPKNDVYSIIVSGEEMTSVSATRLRIIARSYADTHGYGIHEQNRYGSSLWWAAYYYNLCHLEIVTKHGVALAKNWSKFNRKSTDAHGERTWGKKVHTKAKSVWDSFGLGSDIPGNYPIIFGIKESVTTAELPKSMKKWEVRITSPVKFSDVSHIEVPEAKIKETERLLRANDLTIPVFSIEVAEFLSSQKSLAELLYRNRDL